MATTKKSTKRKTRKRSRRYLKKAARRTIAALLMITALIVAAIPATPGRADTGEYGDGENTASGIDFSSEEDIVVSDENKAGPAGATIKKTDVNNNMIYWFKDTGSTVSIDGVTVHEVEFAGYEKYDASRENKVIDIPDVFTNENDETVKCTCVAIGGTLQNDTNVIRFTCNSLKEIGTSTLGSGSSVEYFTCNGVEKVNSNAFSGCTSLKAYNGSKTKIIDYQAFMGCTSLSNCSIPSSMKSIGESAFQNCSSLATMKLPDTLEDPIGQSAFENSGLSGTINVPGSGTGALISISPRAFAECTSITGLTWGPKISILGANAFLNCKMNDLELPDTLESFDSTTFAGCDELVNITIHGSVDIFPENAFKDSNKLLKIDLSNNIDSGDRDIKMDKSKQYFIYPGENKDFYVTGFRKDPSTPSKFTYAYDYCKEYQTPIPYLCKDDDEYLSKYMAVSSSGELLRFDSVEFERDNPLDTTISINSVTVNGQERKITSINGDAFADGVGNLKKIVLGESVSSVKGKAFRNCTLESVWFDSNDTVIEDAEAFPAGDDFYLFGNIVEECKPYHYAMTNDYIFKGYDNYNDKGTHMLTVNGKADDYTVVKIDDNDENKAKYVGLPSGVHYISDKLFKSDTDIVGIKANGLKKLKDGQFEACSSLEDIELPSTLSSIEGLPFESCRNVKKISIADGGAYSCDKYGVISKTDSNGNKEIVEAIENRIESNPSSTRYVIDKEVTSMAPGAFKNNIWVQYFDTRYDDNTDNKTNLTAIPENAFYDATELQYVYLGDKVDYVYANAFSFGSPTAMGKTPVNIEVYNKSISYTGQPFSTNQNKKYRFWGKEANTEDQTYKLCSIPDDNLIWVDVVPDDSDRTDIKTCSIGFVGNVDTLKYEGTDLTWSAAELPAGPGNFYIYDGSYTLKPGTDYDFTTMTGINTTGSHNFTVEGIGNYKGTLTGTFYVVSDTPPTPSTYEVRYTDGNVRYEGSKITWTPSTTGDVGSGEFYVLKDGSMPPLVPDTDYAWEWDVKPDLDNPKEGSYPFTIYKDKNKSQIYTSGELIVKIKEKEKISLSSCEIKYTNGQKRTYTGNTIIWTSKNSRDFYVVDPNGVTLTLGTDYSMDNLGEVKEVRDYAFTIRGKGDYTGAKTGEFSVVPRGSKDTSVSVNLILNGPDRSAVNSKTYKSTNTFQYWNEGDPGVIVTNKDGNTLKKGRDYSIQGFKTVKPGLGKDTGYVTVKFKGNYANEPSQSVFYDIKKDLSKNTSDDGKKSVTISVTEATIDSNDKIEATVFLTDATTGTDLVADTDYQQGSFKKTSSHHADVKITGKGDKYTGTYKYNFAMEEKKSSSSSGSSSSSSSKSSSSSGSSSMMSSSASGSSSSYSGSGNKNSGTTVVNRNYYGKNGGTVDELEDMLRAAHIDSINGGTADGYQVNITKSDEAEASFREALIRRYGSLDNIRYFSMDIDVKDENGNDIDTTGMSVTLTLPLPRSMEQYGTNNKVATVDSNGDLEDLNEQFSTLEGRPCVTFVAPHFSPYGFYVNTADLAVGTLDNTPKTGDPIHPKWFLSFGLAALSIFLFLKRDPKPQVKPA